MSNLKPQTELSDNLADQIINEIGDYNTPRPTDLQAILKRLDIDQRSFCSIITKAIFSSEPTDAQMKLRTHICDILYTELYAPDTYE